MRIRISALVALSVSVASGMVLFWTSQQVQTAETELRRVTAALENEKRTIRVLSAEWDYLNRPDRIEALARTHLKMGPPTVAQLTAAVSVLPESRPPVFPLRKPDMQAQIVSMTPGKKPAAAQPSAPVPAATIPREDATMDTPGFRTLLDEVGRVDSAQEDMP